MKKLMILGASYSQLPLYEAAERLGVKTIAASTPGDWPGFQAADESTYTDISDPGAVMEAARKFQADGITTCCLDTGVRAMGYACEKLGLKGLSEKSADISSNKFKMKEAFMAGGVPGSKRKAGRLQAAPATSASETVRSLQKLWKNWIFP